MSALGGAARASVAGGAFRLPNAAATSTTTPVPPFPSSSQKQQASALFAAPARRRSVARQALPSATTMFIELGLAAAAAWALTAETDPSRRGNRDCVTCGGTGKEECACARWSDSDVGCRTCSGTGMAPCRSCGGGGTAVPVALTARKLAPEDIKRLQEQQERDRRHRG